MDLVRFWITSYGYAGIFGLLMLGIVGLPVPDETLLVFTGYLIYKGHLHPAAALASAFLGSCCGITGSYLIGRTAGLGVLHRYGRWLRVKEADIHRVHDWFERIGHWALFVGYYIPGVRHFTAIVAGSSELELRNFAMYAYSGAFLWVSTFLTLGYLLGDRWEQAFHQIHHHLTIAGVIVIALAAAALAWRYFRRRARRELT